LRQRGRIYAKLSHMPVEVIQTGRVEHFRSTSWWLKPKLKGELDALQV
jgi:hypothetical protein